MTRKKTDLEKVLDAVQRAAVAVALGERRLEKCQTDVRTAEDEIARAQVIWKSAVQGTVYAQADLERAREVHKRELQACLAAFAGEEEDAHGE
jgi:hypothetical protein